MRAGSPSGRWIAVLLPLYLLVSVTGCGFLFSHAPPPGHEQMTSFTCSEENTPATLDVIWGGLNVLGAIAAAADPGSYANPDEIVVTGLAWGVLSSASAASGFHKTKECRAAKAALAQRQHTAISGMAPTLQTGGPAVVEISPAVDTLHVGDRVQLQATAQESSGALIPGRTYVWTSSNDAIASVNVAGNVFANAVGSVVIAARTGTVVGTAHIVVLAP